ncbi:CoA transferase [Orrella daihaiensis]|uniref:CoA transferase n=1 Tax=Orrella daihaiensis TaxID=2782176 RepID=A0ABY4AI85_9BURK|nr:CaiB/BaiF CoA-transferase family protein [Orrella daihaiensis]UOD50001.1 CoA transferase [Orrella daihaiensis]
MSESLPLTGIRVVEFTHMVMGPTCGMILADLGADVIKVEPLTGDNTRKLMGSGAGFFPLFNRNKKSLAVDVKTEAGHDIVHRLIKTADVFSENFKSGTMDKLGLGEKQLRSINPGLIYVSHKGFLPGPYEQRTALDEVVQMMGGLAYMTGPQGRPLRAGSSVNDIMGGMFGAIGALAALHERGKTGRGHSVKSALFENNVFLVAQHMMQYAVTGKPAAPMPNRISAWGIYDVFTVKDGAQIFLSVVSDTQWQIFCDEFGFSDLFNNQSLASNNQRVQARDWLMPILRERFANLSAKQLSERFEARGLPYAPITRPEELFDDPHLKATVGLVDVTIPPDGSCANATVSTQVPLIPIEFDGQRLGVRHAPPAIGNDTSTLLNELGFTPEEIAALTAQGVIHTP